MSTETPADTDSTMQDVTSPPPPSPSPPSPPPPPPPTTTAAPERVDPYAHLSQSPAPTGGSGQSRDSTETKSKDNSIMPPRKPATSNGETLPLQGAELEDTQDCRAVCVRGLKGNALILATLGAVVLGVCLGLGLRETNPSKELLMWLGLPGELFLRCLKATIVPLVICMVITSTASLDPRSNGKIAVAGTAGFLLSQVAAVLLAVCLFFAFRPDAKPLSDDEVTKFSTDLSTQDVFADLIRNIFPDNVVSATFTQTTTQYKDEIQVKKLRNFSEPSNFTLINVSVQKKSLGTGGGSNILGLIAVCSAIGIACNQVLEQDSEFLRFFRQGQQVIFVVIRWLFWTTPVGVTSLITVSIAGVDDIADVFRRLGLLVASVTVGLVIYQMVVWPAVIFLFTRRNPFMMLVKCIRPFVIAFAATATSVAMPDMLTSSDICGVDRKVSSFVIPMSVTLHADGSALYIASSALFLAQATIGGVSTEDVVIIGAISPILSLAIPPVPSASIVTLVIILTSLNYPLNDVALLFAVEWILDRLRSGVNAIGHVMVAIVVDAICNPRGKGSSAPGIETGRQPRNSSTSSTDFDLVVSNNGQKLDEGSVEYNTEAEKTKL